MKRFITFLTFALVLTGCSLGEDMNNTPTKKVEEYLGNYQTLDSNVLAKLDSIVNNEELFDIVFNIVNDDRINSKIKLKEKHI